MALRYGFQRRLLVPDRTTACSVAHHACRDRPPASLLPEQLFGLKSTETIGGQLPHRQGEVGDVLR